MIQDYIDRVIGTESDIEWWQMAIRAFLIFIIAVIIIRISNKRIFGKYSAFDIVLGIILGSILSRAITANSPFFPTIIAAVVLVLMHRVLGLLSYKIKGFGTFIKGHRQVLVKDGEIQWDQMLRQSISRKDLEEAVRIRTNVTDFSLVKYAYLERSGDISVILKDRDTD